MGITAISAVLAVSATSPVNPQLQTYRCAAAIGRNGPTATAGRARGKCSGGLLHHAPVPSGIALRVNISISQLCEPSYRYPKLRGINHACSSCQVLVGLSAVCRRRRPRDWNCDIGSLRQHCRFSCCGRRLQSSYQFANLSAKGDRLSLPATTWTRSLTKQSDPRLPDGCESLVSFLTTSDNAIVAVFCET